LWRQFFLEQELSRVEKVSLVREDGAMAASRMQKGLTSNKQRQGDEPNNELLLLLSPSTAPNTYF